MENKDLDYASLVRAKRDGDKHRETRYKDSSKDRFKKIATTKVKTTMIGALSAIEKKLGFLWGLNDEGEDTGKTLSPEETHLKEIYDELRSEVLDIGNNQIRNLATELEQYEVSWNRYHMTLPVVPEGPKAGETNE